MSPQDRFDEENLVMRATGLSRQDVRGLDPERFERVAQEARADGKADKISGAKFERAGETPADEVLRQLRAAKPKDADKPLPGTPEALLRPVERRDDPLPGDSYNDADAADAADDAADDAGGAEPTEKLVSDLSWDDSAGKLVVTYNDGTTKDITFDECPT